MVISGKNKRPVEISPVVVDCAASRISPEYRELGIGTNFLPRILIAADNKAGIVHVKKQKSSITAPEPEKGRLQSQMFDGGLAIEDETLYPHII
jgi:hypothetical protein